MTKGAIKILLIEDNPGDARIIKEILGEQKSSRFDLEWVDRLSEGIDHLENNITDIVLLDLKLPDSSGIDTFVRLSKHMPHVPVVILTGTDDEQVATSLLRCGLQDYLVKGNVNGELLARSIRYAIERKRLEEEIWKARNELEMRVMQRTMELSDANKTLKDEIAERIKIEEELKQSKAQTELYVDLMAHDINNMNQIAMGFLEMALEDPALDDKTKMMVSKPIDVLKSSTKLIDNVRKIQRITHNGLKKKTMDLGLILSEAIKQYSDVPGNNVLINYSPVGDCHVFANDFLIDVFTNLIGNSIKHSNGSVSIDITLSKQSDYHGNNYYLVTVADDGPGISDELKFKIFNRFLRGETKARGSGIGLYLVQALVNDFSGKVWVEDRVSGDRGKGSKFFVELPAA
jgi:signal transduction histidine kinase